MKVTSGTPRCRSIKLIEIRTMFLQRRLHSLQTLPFAIGTTRLRWPAMLAKNPLEHRDHPVGVFGWTKSGLACNDLCRVYKNPLEPSELLLQKLDKFRDCPAREFLLPCSFILGHTIIHIPGIDALDERRIIIEVVSIITTTIRFRPLVEVHHESLGSRRYFRGEIAAQVRGKDRIERRENITYVNDTKLCIEGEGLCSLYPRRSDGRYIIETTFT